MAQNLAIKARQPVACGSRKLARLKKEICRLRRRRVEGFGFAGVGSEGSVEA